MSSREALGPLAGLRVLELTQRAAPALGGVERHVDGVVRTLRAAGASVSVSTTDLRRERPFERLPTGSRTSGDPGIHRHRAFRLLPAPHGLGTTAPGQWLEALRAEVDVIHAHAFGFPPTWAGRFAAAVRPRPLVITPHADAGAGTRASRAYARLVARATLRGADHVIALTEGERSLLVGWGVRPDRVSVIPNGIDLAEFGEPTAPPDRPGLQLLFVGRIYPEQKGVDLLIEAMAQLPPGREVRLRLAGEDWGSWAGLQRRSAELGLADRVEYLGPVDRPTLRAEYRAADLVVVPSRFEPFGIVILEAMASGRPVVATRVGGIPEVVREGETGALVPPGDSGRLAAEIARLAEDPALRRQWGAAARVAAARYDWSVIAPRLIATFARVVEEARR